jgi:hypothetical protein
MILLYVFLPYCRYLFNISTVIMNDYVGGSVKSSILQPLVGQYVLLQEKTQTKLTVFILDNSVSSKLCTMQVEVK